MKIQDSTIDPAPPLDFKYPKSEYHKQKSKFLISDKVQNVNHWRLTDKVGDIQFRKGIKPNLKWSDKESYYKTGVVERDPDELTTEQFK